jgi:hypothetical protein
VRDPLKFKKCGQLFIRVHNVAFTVVAVCVRNKDRSPVRVYSCDTTPGPTGFAEIVSDDFPLPGHEEILPLCSPHGHPFDSAKIP